MVAVGKWRENLRKEGRKGEKGEGGKGQKMAGNEVGNVDPDCAVSCGDQENFYCSSSLALTCLDSADYTDCAEGCLSEDFETDCESELFRRLRGPELC